MAKGRHLEGEQNMGTPNLVRQALSYKYLLLHLIGWGWTLKRRCGAIVCGKYSVVVKGSKIGGA